MVGMIIVNARREDDIGIPLADEPDDLRADLQGGQEFAVVVLKHLVLGDPETFGGFLGLRAPAFGERSTPISQCPASPLVVRNEFHQMTLGGEPPPPPHPPPSPKGGPPP